MTCEGGYLGVVTQQRRPAWDFNDMGVQHGAGARDIFVAMPSTPDYIAAQDVTIVVCMLNKLKNMKSLGGLRTARLLLTSSAYARTCDCSSARCWCLAALRGFGDIRAISDQLVENCVAVARAHGIPTITSESYFSFFERHADGIHSQHTEKNGLLYSRLFEETVS